jgi:hypothetical protein
MYVFLYFWNGLQKRRRRLRHPCKLSLQVQQLAMLCIILPAVIFEDFVEQQPESPLPPEKDGDANRNR